MARAAAIIIKDGSAALIRRVRSGRTYFLFPGGQIEEGETPEAALIREIKEELGLEARIGRLVAEVVFEGKSQLHYLAEVSSPTFGTITGLEMLGLLADQAGTYDPIWMPVPELAQQPVYPKFVADLAVLSIDHGWPSGIQYFVED